ncbi:MAG: hypothetical protein JO199_08425, partial [Candidatus Eremiobacteraeota bacterium]|nr:hypothetical protein [Candidatus Eremiobacteraeota bacterium]
MWFVTSGSSKHPSAVGAMTTTGAVTAFIGGRHAGLTNDPIGYFGIAAGPDGNLWFSEPANATIARITPSGAVTETAAGGALPFKVTPGPRSSMWYTINGASAIGEITTAARPSVTVYAIPSPLPGATSNPQSIVAGTDGNLYFTDCG